VEGFGADAPLMIEWRIGHYQPKDLVGYGNRTPQPPETKRSVVKPYIPIGTTGWRLPGETEWQDLATLPPSWRKAVDVDYVEEHPEEETMSPGVGLAVKMFFKDKTKPGSVGSKRR
jgi:hypothetical protein